MASIGDEAGKDAIYRVLLAKLMEAQSSSMTSSLNRDASLSHASAVGGGGGGSSAALSPPSSSSSASSASFSTPSPTKDATRIGQKRPSPYGESTPPPFHPSPSQSFPSSSSTLNTPTSSSSSSLPNFLLVKVTDLRNVDKLQALLARHGFTETRLVLATDPCQPQPPPPPPPPQPLPTGNMPRSACSPSLLQPMQGMALGPPEPPPTINHSIVPEVAAEEEVMEDDDEVTVEVVDEGQVMDIGQRRLMDGEGGDRDGTLLTPSPRDDAPSDIQVAEVRHRSVSRSDGVDNDDVYVKCRLCENRIMNTRLSNLTNHVRRHAKLKQFQCAHCSYEHNEIFKVRTHMSRAHGDSHSAPLDRRTPEMERQWEALMHACFPRNNLIPQPNGTTTVAQLAKEQAALMASSSGDRQRSPSLISSKAAQHASRSRASPSSSSLPNPPQSGMYTCNVCRDTIPEASIVAHSRDEHQAMLPHLRFFICRECGFKAPDKDRVRLHAASTHDVSDTVAISVEQRPSLLMQKMFPEKRVVTNDDCECSRSEERTAEEEEDERASGHGGQNNGSVHVCRMCNRVLRSAAGALMHAKHHYPTRQFHCTLCLFSAVDEAKVRAHLLTKHLSVDQPINVVNAPMQRGWMDTMESCFPELTMSAAQRDTISGGNNVDDIAEDRESDTKRRKLEKAAREEAEREGKEGGVEGTMTTLTTLEPMREGYGREGMTIRRRREEEEEDEEIDVV